MSASLGATTYSAVTWTAGDVITEAKLDAMVANDQAYDSHSAQGILLNNEKALAGKNASGTAYDLMKLNSANEEVGGLYHSGWNIVDETWTYASATTINVPSGATGRFQKGDRLRLKQGAGYKYYYVVGVASTLLTVTGGTDYTVANAAITDIYFSREVNPIGFPDTFAFTPVVTSASGTLTTVSAEGTIKIYKTRVEVKIKYAISNNGTGATGLYLTIPVSPSPDYYHAVYGWNHTTGCGMAGRVSVANGLEAYKYDGSYIGTTGSLFAIYEY